MFKISLHLTADRQWFFFLEAYNCAPECRQCLDAVEYGSGQRETAQIWNSTEQLADGDLQEWLRESAGDSSASSFTPPVVPTCKGQNSIIIFG